MLVVIIAIAEAVVFLEALLVRLILLVMSSVVHGSTIQYMEGGQARLSKVTLHTPVRTPTADPSKLPEL